MFRPGRREDCLGGLSPIFGRDVPCKSPLRFCFVYSICLEVGFAWWFVALLSLVSCVIILVGFGKVWTGRGDFARAGVAGEEQKARAK